MERQYTKSKFNYDLFLSQIPGSKVYAAKHSGTTLILYIKDDASEQDLAAIDAAVEAHDADSLSKYRIIDLLNEDFKYLPIENIDFVRHVKADIALNKVVTKGIDGRPIKSEYFYGDIIHAEIVFSFEATDDNILISRKETLFYYKENGQKSPAILIKSKTFDPISNPTDAELVVAERVNSRQAIVSGINGFLSGVLANALGITIPEVIVTIQPFWQEYEKDRLSFIDFGLPDWGNKLQLINLNSTVHTWLGIPVDNNGTTVRDYIVSRVLY